MTTDEMIPDVSRAQADVRRVYSGGWGGPAVSALVWLASALTADLVGLEVGASVLFIGGAALIFPLNLLLNRMMSGSADLPPGHPMRGLAVQSAATMVVVLLSLWLLSSVMPNAFFPLAMVAVGAHYFPFAHLYGDKAFVINGVVQCVAGLLILVTGPSGSLGAYVMAALLALMSTMLLVRHRARAR